MLPPIDPTVLQRNPNFEILYKDLCTRKLNHNGSTRDTKKQRVHDEIRKVMILSMSHIQDCEIPPRSLRSLLVRGTQCIILCSVIYLFMKVTSDMLSTATLSFCLSILRYSCVVMLCPGVTLSC